MASEMIKFGGNQLLEEIYRLIMEIWEKESMLEEWNLSLIYPIHKKGNKLECGNYRGISLLNIGYKIMSAIVYERLRPLVERIVELYQCGFMAGRSTPDQVFAIRQILEKTREFQIETHHLFDFKTAYDCTIRERLFEVMKDFDIPRKLIKLCRMTMKDTMCGG